MTGDKDIDAVGFERCPSNVDKPQLCDSLPDDKEIEFVASDESNGVDVDDLKSRPIWADGFIEGAKWMRSRIK